MKTDKRMILAVVVLGLLIPIVTTVVWLSVANRTARYEALAQQAAQNGDWERAAELAAKSDSEHAEELRAEIAYRRAEQALEEGDYASAEEAFSALGTYRDAQTRVRECRYRMARALEESGDDAAAQDAYFALIPYADASERYSACGYRIAERMLQNGEGHEAFRAFCALIPYADSETRATEIAVALTGETDPEKAVLLAKGVSEEDWNRLEQIAQARSTLTSGRIAAGHAHAAFLFSDGSVRAFGDNAYGQCDVDAFQTVTAIAAGYRHTIGLKADGTVVAAGDNTYGQCGVTAWTDVVSIACGPWDSFAIRADGTLLHCGFSEYDLSGWTGLQKIAACEMALIGVREDGTLLCSRPEESFAGASFCDACIVNGTAFALDEDGLIHSDGFSFDEWKDTIALSSSAAVLVGIRADRSLCCRALMPCKEAFLSALSAETDVAEVAPAGAYALILHCDGTLSAAGDVPEEIAAFIETDPVL